MKGCAEVAEMNERREFKSAARVHRSLTASAEKRLLVWMAQRTPAEINSDHLTALGLGSQLAAGLAYAFADVNALLLVVASLFIVLNWLGDSLDGTLARVRNQQRPRYGFYVDHVSDILGSAALMVGLGCSGYVHMTVALGMLIAFLLLSGESFLATYALGRFHMSQGVFGPTEIRILLIVGNCVLLVHPHARLFGREYLLFDIGGVIAIIGMLTVFVCAAARHTAELYGQETRW